MANLYKKSIVVLNRETGEQEKRRSKKWWGRYRDENRIERRAPLATDKTAAQAMLNGLVRLAERRAAGIMDPLDEHQARPIKDHLAAFEKYLRCKGNSETYVALTSARTKLIVEHCGADRLADLSPSKVQVYLAELREGGKRIQTSNHYLRAIKHFARWLVKDRRVSYDPLASVSMLNCATDRRHVRRPLSQEELTALLRAAATGPVVLKLSGPDRAMLYATAVYTGLRVRELASLTPASFELGVQPPLVTVDAAYSKHRRQDILPLHASLLEQLEPWLRLRPAGKPLWPGRWAQSQAAAMMQSDVKAAGIPYRDERGRYADFHALRHTFVTNLVRSGAAPKVAQSLARHSTIDLTMNVYTSLTVSDGAVALASLPALPSVGHPA